MERKLVDVLKEATERVKREMDALEPLEHETHWQNLHELEGHLRRGWVRQAKIHRKVKLRC